MILLYIYGSGYRPVARKEEQQQEDGDDFSASLRIPSTRYQGYRYPRWWSSCFARTTKTTEPRAAQHCAQMIAPRSSSHRQSIRLSCLPEPPVLSCQKSLRFLILVRHYTGMNTVLGNKHCVRDTSTGTGFFYCTSMIFGNRWTTTSTVDTWHPQIVIPQKVESSTGRQEIPFGRTSETTETCSKESVPPRKANLQEQDQM
jgi:hypothetical protein